MILGRVRSYIGSVPESGGFSLPINPLVHLNFLYRVQKDLQASVGDVGVIAFEYSLAPEAQFPTQLRQFNAAISFLISKGIMPANIVLGGDSAGGNIAFQIASHIMHPLPNFPAPATSGPLAGALLISPWITFDDPLPSFVENDRLDTPNTNFFNFLADQFRSGITPETRAYFEPFAANDSWWIGLEKVFPRIICSAGEVECLRDSILAFGETLKKYVKDTTITLEKNGVHLDVLRFAVGQGGKSDGYKVDIEWLSDTFKGQR
ncbi:hypothetical protein HETIRDRAFT_471997 [Heterobasidion irregulare TC 32-1]|uniref:Alpha/beta hydrolase fold-3 domain-containing protein n=1 Tax=Heterobasidion irregulare (strain TC 32-1) TaxID=747525 RepID=W4KF82_HETIT|nr:uncharacterized protein HETIRDRAFT_471997 [Heterobasidion irregulare TC 32-1]ETW83716.1 hypothetical protein HETIRDRAFT_471997 [Heterobasidion irregulare TC 32-1]